MKKQHPHPPTALLLLALSMLFLPALSAQTDATNTTTNSNTGSNQSPPPPHRQGWGPMANLTEAEKAQLKAAHDKAIAQDPSLDQTMKAAIHSIEDARKALQAAMIQVDPTVAPILEKMHPLKGWKEHSPHAEGATNSSGDTNSVSTNAPTAGSGSHEGHGLPSGFANLSPDEQAKLKALHEQVKNDSSVVAAREAIKNAGTPEQRHEAKEAMHKAVRDAILKADPSMESILQKLHPDGQPSQPQ